MPSTADFEGLILASVVLDADKLAGLATELTEDKFSIPINRSIYATMLKMWIDKIPIDIPNLTARLYEVKGAEAYITSLVSNFFDMGGNLADENIAEWARQVDARGRLRQAAMVSNELSQLFEDFESLAGEVGDRVDEFISDYTSKLQKVIEGVKTDYVTAYDAGNKLERMLDQEGNGVATTTIDCGLLSFTKHVLFPIGLTVLQGVSGSGKTSIALQALLGTAIKMKEYNLPGCVSIQELEMLDWRLIQRMASMLSGVAFEKIQKGQADKFDTERFRQAIEFVKSLPIHINASDAQTSFSAISSNVALNLRNGPLRMTVSDYAELFHDKRVESEELRISQIVHNHHALYKRTNSATILISQITVPPGNRTLFVGPGGGRYSKALWHASDVLVELYCPPAMKSAALDFDMPIDIGLKDDTVAHFVIEKYRDGQTGKFTMGWDGERTVFLDPLLSARMGNKKVFDTELYYGEMEEGDF